MHELSVTQSIVDTIVERMGERPVKRVRLEIGQVSGVLADAVRFCFDVVARGTTLEDAALEIDEPAGLGRCRACGAQVAVADLLTQCGCDSFDIEVLSGHQLRIREVEVGSDVRNLRV